MGVLSGALINCIACTSIIMFSLPYVLNYAILQTMPSIAFEIMIPCVFVVSYFIGMFGCIYASSSECDVYKKGLAVKKGFKQAFIATLVYSVVWFFPWFKSPFVEIGGDNILANSAGESFILGMTSIALIIDNYFDSAKEGCRMSKEQSEKAYAKLEKKLHSRSKKTPPPQVKITQ